LAGKRRNSGYYFQLFLKLEQRKENKKYTRAHTHTHTHREKNPDLVLLEFVAGRKVRAYIEVKF